MYLQLPIILLIFTIMKREDRHKHAIYVGDKDNCFKAYALLPHKQVFETTLRWLKKGVPEYEWLIFDTEHWFGVNDIDDYKEVTEYEGEYRLKEKKFIKVIL